MPLTRGTPYVGDSWASCKLEDSWRTPHCKILFRCQNDNTTLYVFHRLP